MGKARKIEKRTLDFIAEFNRLRRSGQIPDLKTVASIIGAESVSTVSEIMAQRQNIQPEQWRLFREHFGIEIDECDTENSDPMEVFLQVLSTLADAYKVQANAVGVQADAFKAHVAILGDIEKNMARQTSQARIESNLTEVLTGVERIAVRQDEVLKEILESVARLRPPS